MNINSTFHLHLSLLHSEPPKAPEDSLFWSNNICELNLSQQVGTWCSCFDSAVLLIFYVIGFETARPGWELYHVYSRTSATFILTNPQVIQTSKGTGERNQWGPRCEQPFALWTGWRHSVCFHLGMSCFPPCLCKMSNGIQEITLSLLIKEITSKGQIAKILWNEMK